jgi:uncharacterized protein YndB with AHSA1/START domain
VDAAFIRATPEAVWAILTDGPGHASWNPEINRVTSSRFFFRLDQQGD